ncbi:hypothetical protein SAMN04488134_102245 [Amphibacillus marinus]|uniref:Uncharacterized protein n=1 Tax=Amphibacillus marinus TaxID=872970 RepID=A0A1H8KCM8_9BACI|nr:hypothetical protein [Amphibacillus marinus]SEN90605.1 hypothetical protein SAMN04488134_102245 [Amphibacillus marinus]
MKIFKDKLYWYLMPPFFIISLIAFFVLPDSQYIAFLVILLFWVAYYMISYYLKRKREREQV